MFKTFISGVNRGNIKNALFLILPSIFFVVTSFIAFIIFAIATPNSYPVKSIFIYLLPISIF